MNEKEKQAIIKAARSAHPDTPPKYIDEIMADIEGQVEMEYNPIELISDENGKQYAWFYGEDDKQAIVAVDTQHQLSNKEIEGHLGGLESFSHIHMMDEQTRLAVTRIIYQVGTPYEISRIDDYIYDIEDIQRVSDNPLTLFADEHLRRYVCYPQHEIIIDIETLSIVPWSLYEALFVIELYPHDCPNIATMRKIKRLLDKERGEKYV